MTAHAQPITLPPAAVSAPNERWTGLIALLAVFVLVVFLSWFRLGDVDAGYHLAYGRTFLDSGRIVDRDPFIQSENAKDFINANWGSQVLMALVERALGVSGLIVLRSILLLCVFGMLALIAWRLSGSLHAVAWACLLAAVAAYERFSMRPELFSYAIMMVQLWFLVRGIRSWPGIGLLMLLQLLWVNLHSYFMVGILITLAMLAGGLVADYLARRKSVQTPQETRRRLLIAALIGQIAVCFINPWHWRGAAFPLRTLQYLQQEDVLGGEQQAIPRNAWAEISEFRSPLSFMNERINYRTISAYFVCLVVAVLGCASMIAMRRMDLLIVVVLLVLMSFQMRRNIAQFALVASPLSIGIIASCFAGLIGAFRPLVRAASLGGVVLISGFWTWNIHSGRFYFVERRINREFGAGYSDSTYPRRAVEWLAGQQALKPELFVDYFSSSNALPWLPERFRLFVDTNTFAYSESVLRTSFDVGLGRLPHAEFFDKHRINVLLLHAGPDTQMLIRAVYADRSNWALVYVDPYAMIFVRRIAEHAPVILANLPSPENIPVNQWINAVSGGAYHQAQTICLMANVPICLGWSRPALTLIEHALRRVEQYPEAWYLAATAHGNLAKAAARGQNIPELKKHCRAALEAAARSLALEPDNERARQIHADMREMVSRIDRM